MKLLVTGGAGFIGSNFIHYWLRKYPDDEIVNLDKLTYAGNLGNLKELAGKSHYRFIKGDICNPEIIKEAVANIDIIVHFAAETHVDRSIKNPSEFVKTNVNGTQLLLEAALNKKIKHFHHISTDEVFGSIELEEKTKWTEKSPYNPRSPYSASKAASDHFVRAYYTTYGLPITITNCSNNFGPYQFPEKLIPLAITNIIRGKKVPVYGDGLYVRDWLYVEDHCSAIDTVIKKGKIGETYLVGAYHQEINNLELTKIILAIMGKSEEWIEFVEDRPGHDRKYALDWTKIKNELDWQPKYQLNKALERTIAWYKENESWWKNLI